MLQSPEKINSNPTVYAVENDQVWNMEKKWFVHSSYTLIKR